MDKDPWSGLLVGLLIYATVLAVLFVGGYWVSNGISRGYFDAKIRYENTRR